MLKVAGREGVGRVAVAASTEGEPLRITYPVRSTLVLLHDNDMHFNFNHLDAFRA